MNKKQVRCFHISNSNLMVYFKPSKAIVVFTGDGQGIFYLGFQYYDFIGREHMSLLHVQFSLYIIP